MVNRVLQAFEGDFQKITKLKEEVSFPGNSYE